MKKYWIVWLFTPWMVYGQTDSLNHYLQIAAQNNPAVKAAFLSYEAALQKAPQAGALDDLRLDMGFFLQPMELVEGRQIAQVQLMQMFPWFGTRKAARTEAQQMAQMAFEEFREMKDKLYLEIYSQWYVLCALKQKVANNGANQKLLRQLEDLALRRFAAGATVSSAGGTMAKAENIPSSGTVSMSGMNMGASPLSSNPSTPSASNSMGNKSAMPMGNSSSGLSEVLRIQLEIMELENSYESLLSELTAGKARFNTLLNRPASSEVMIPDTVLPLYFPVNIEQLAATMQTQNPLLAMLQAEALAYQSQEEMVKKMGYPMFGVGIQYMLIGKKPETIDTHSSGTMNNMNGKDMIMPMLSLSLPVYRNKYKAARKEVQILQLANREKQADAFNRLQADLWQSKHQLDDASRKIALYKKQAGLAQTTYDLAVQEFISGKNTLGDVIQIQRQLLDYQLKTAESTADYNTMVATIQKIISQWQ
ncbi:MAG: TolC family protein [Dysgonamonadaceae bacterium]|jgi:outer membrane protein TolC|nr:TolC family protein [Dysgonamonadaceae bacterium]